MDSKLLDKFFKKECTPHEVLQVLEWFSHHGIEPEQQEAMHAFWIEAERESQQHRFAYDVEGILESIHQQMDSKYITPLNAKQGRLARLSDSWTYISRVAAILLIATLFSVLAANFLQTKERAVPVSMVKVETSPGSKLTKMLPDGSKVILNAHSRIEYPENFKENREIVLSGEAFFEVAKDTAHPFVVHTGSISTTALGTSFNIYFRPQLAPTEVSLATGIVEVRISDQQDVINRTKLQPGEKVLFDPSQEVFKKERFDEQEVLSWKEGILYFKRADIEQITQELEDWYGVEITLEGNIDQIKTKTWTYTGIYDNESLENVLKGISYVKGFAFEIDRKKVRLIFK